MSEQEPNDEELRAALEDQMRRIRVEDVIVQTVVTLVNLAGRRLGLAGPPEEAGGKDLDQSRLAIEGARALLPLLPADHANAVRDALAQLQMAYAREAGGAPPPPASPQPGQPQARETEADRDEQERAKARSKLWTPPGV